MGSTQAVSALVHSQGSATNCAGVQLLPMQASPGAHSLPQVPQLAASVLASVQVAPMVEVDAHVAAPAHDVAGTHVPAIHVWRAPHVVWQLPQCAGSVSRFTHLPSHCNRPAAQLGVAHDLEEQIWPWLQALLQLPQNCGSLFWFTQAAPPDTLQLVRAPAQPHWPPLQTSPTAPCGGVAQETPQALQFCTSLLVSASQPFSPTPSQSS